MPLVLRDHETRQALTMADAIAAIEDACREQAAGTAVAVERRVMWLPNGWMRLLPGALVGSGVMGYKAFHRTGPSVRYAVHLFDSASGEAIAFMDGSYITAVRTGAAAGVAVKHLAPVAAAALGVIGSGSEARTQVEAVGAVRPLRRAKVYSPNPQRRERFAREMGERLGIEIHAVDEPQKAIEDVEILVVATNTGGTGPALLGRWLRKGLHINSIGSTLRDQREIDPAVWAFADRIVIDSRHVLEESGDGIAAREANAIDERKVTELHEVVAGKMPGRTLGDQTTLYKSVGLGLHDVAVAFRIYRQARARGLGRHVEDFQAVISAAG
jgi:ornithine cyclodeaminase/alanine dehydrogenase